MDKIPTVVATSLLLFSGMLCAGTTGSISGTVRTADASAPIESAQVFALSSSAPGTQFQTQTDAAGNYAMPVADGTYAVVASKTGLEPELYLEQPCCNDPGLATPVVVSGNTASGIDFTLSAGSQITGRVTRFDNATALAGVSVQARLPGTTTVVATATTDALGDYTLAVSAGNWDIGVLGGGTFGDETYPGQQCWNGQCAGVATPQSVGAGSTLTGIDFALAPPARITLGLRQADSFQLLNGQLTYWVGEVPPTSPTGQAVIAAGSVVLEFPGADTVRFAAESPECEVSGNVVCLPELYPDLPCVALGCDPNAGTPIMWTKGQQINGPTMLLDRGGVIRGQVGSAGSPLNGASVQLFPISVTAFNDPPLMTATTNPDGTYRLGGLVTANYYVLARSPGYIPVLFQGEACPMAQCPPASGDLVAVMQTAETPNIDFVLAPGGNLSGQIRDMGRDQPLGGATAHAHRSDGAEVMSVMSASDGTWRIDDLPVGTWYVRFSHPQFGGELFDSIPCPDNNCIVTTGTPITLTSGSDIAGINGALRRVDGGDGNFRLIYLNHCQTGNCTFTRGNGVNNASANQSSLVTSGTRTLSPFTGTTETWEATVACIRDVLRPYRLTVTTTDPGATPHHEAVIAGTPTQLGVQSGIAGVSPFTCGEIQRSITFTFGNLFPNDVLELCWTATHEIAHSFGLEHETYCPDSMTYATGCGFKRYTDVVSPVGTQGPCQPAGECQCGPTTQNAHQSMLGAVGPNQDVFGDGFENESAAKRTWRQAIEAFDGTRDPSLRCGTMDHALPRGTWPSERE